MGLQLKGQKLSLVCDNCGKSRVVAFGAVATVANLKAGKWCIMAIKIGWRPYKKNAECAECVGTLMKGQGKQRLAARHKIIMGK